ncbi:MAG: lipoyl(octanoyl) transferase LipB [Cytophagales bacterium]|nr:lipoyl(octanoyl) transferase LipB [Cytophagales bacterium]
MNLTSSLQCINWGTVPYAEAVARQEALLAEIVAIKTANRQRPAEEQQSTPNYLVFCEHPHVYTLGKSGSVANLLVNTDELAARGAEFYRTGRGGDITYHGPGQLVVYPILDLENFFTDIHRYLRLLEQAVIESLALYGLDTGRIAGLTGVWLDHNQQRAPRKICALGVRTSRWVTMHGLALNVNTDLSYFQHIVPCGIADKAVTSMQAELGRALPLAEVQAVLQAQLTTLFQMEVKSPVASTQ